MRNITGIGNDTIEAAAAAIDLVIPPEHEKIINAFVEAMNESVAKYVEASIHFVTLVDLNPLYRAMIRRAGNFTNPYMNRMEAIGRGTLHPELLHADTPGRLAIIKFPLSVQRYCIENLIPVLLPDGDHQRVHLDKLTRDQIRQVFSRDGLRDLATQKSFLLKEKASRSVPRWKIAGGNLVITAGPELVIPEDQVIQAFKRYNRKYGKTTA